jgi:nucleoid DNA-binding protein
MEIANHIRDLLYHHDCVIVPGFGGFVTNECHARIDRATGSFYPPSREVGFNGRLDHNDGLLISYLSSRMSMNYVDVRKLVEAYVKEVNEKLVSGRTVQLEGIGRFTVDRNHNLRFEPDPAANFLTGSYGLSFFRYPAIGRQASGLHKEGDEGNTSFLHSSAGKILRYAAITIPLVVALSWGAMNTGIIREFNFDLSSLNPFTAVIDSGLRYSVNDEAAVAVEKPGSGLRYSEQDEAAAAVEETGSIQLDAGAETLVIPDQPPAGSFETPGQIAEVAADEPQPEIHSEARQGRLHFLVAGSFMKRQNAVTLSAQLAAEGFNSEIIESENGMFRVSLFSTRNRRESLQMLRQVRAETNNPEIWLLSI